MTTRPLLPMALIALAALSGCQTTPPNNTLLDEAHSDFRIATDTPQSNELAGLEMKQASDALTLADEAWARRDTVDEVDHLAYLAKQKVAIAQQTVRQKGAEATVANAGAKRDKTLLAARTAEVDTANRSAQMAQQDAAMSQRQAAQSQSQATDAQARNQQLMALVKDMNAQQTDRGLVVTIGDVLFDTDRAQLQSGGMRSIDKLVSFLKSYPQRTALVEGFTDSTGSNQHNQALSGRRAEAVRAAMVDQGIGRERVSSQGYGEAFPVADNDSAGGRQLNRRVEVIVSEDGARISPRAVSLNSTR